MIIPFGQFRDHTLLSVPDNLEPRYYADENILEAPEKRCTKCLIKKPYNEFQADKSSHANKDGYTAWCKKCRQEATAKHSKLNYAKKRATLYEWRIQNPGKIRAISKKCRDKNKVVLAGKTALWKEANPQKVLVYYKNYNKKRYQKVQCNLSMRISRSIHHSIGKNKAGKHWETLVGYTLDQLKMHIEKQFVDGMSWDNRSEWHIDHKIPVSAFNFETPEDIDFKKCWELKNLRPMWAKDNIIKGKKLDSPFQPSLLIGKRWQKK